MKRRPCGAALLGILLALTMGSLTALAAEDYGYLGLEAVEEGVPESGAELMDGISLSPTLDAAEALRRILQNASEYIKGALQAAAGEASLALAAALACSVAQGADTTGKSAELTNLAGVFAVAASSAWGLSSMTKLTAGAMEDLSAFSKLLLPALASASAAAGAVTSSAAKYAAASLFMNLLVTLGRRVVLPVIYMFLAVSAGAAAFGGGLAGVAALLAKIVKLLLTVLTMAFTLFVTLTGLVSSAADATAVKLTRTAMSALIPIVGGMASDATDAVVSGAALLRNAVGAFGVLAVVAVCALPFLRLAAHSLLYRLSAALAETVADKRLAGFIGAVSSAYSMALALTGTSALILFVSVLSVARTVTGV